MKNLLFSTLCLVSLTVPITSCREKGPAEKAGESIDRAAENVKDTIDPKGPLEKAGEKIDNAH